ncbi:NUDIX hydrolase [Tabrizicola oligotrophica]|uniref:NUDIX hydrolase n=1 Tax=Tabrizicola oligotrophica TaxID=2710650 RepID=A0A6M0QY44_9RHOB|nr:NUDIX hydrolase [Tabrizicola oligotrophica]NEY91891.1 NUDIX hydrolase [Tabrizicola oligotrophica]
MSEAAAEPVRAAATVILWREAGAGREILMGQRGAGAVFMPSKYVFPGGAVDAEDRAGAAAPVSPDCRARLGQRCSEDAPDADTLARAALRELHEETGLRPAAGAPMRFVFRAITPPGRSRRFDARFFLIPAAGVQGDAQGFSDATDELSHLHWIGLAEARALDLPFITEVVLAEVTALLAGAEQPGVPFFDNSGPVPTFRRL